MPEHIIRSEKELAALFGPVAQASIRKQVDHIHQVYRAWIEASPFAVLATSGLSGLAVSPRGDPAPLVRVVDEKTLLLAERRGNNRIDGLRNLLDDSRISLLFLVPGIGESLRVSGRAEISVEPKLLESFAIDGALPMCVVRVKVESVFFQCGRAMLRSGIWNQLQVKPNVPTAGAMLSAITNNEVGGASYDEELPQRQRSTLY